MNDIKRYNTAKYEIKMLKLFLKKKIPIKIKKVMEMFLIVRIFTLSSAINKYVIGAMIIILIK